MPGERIPLWRSEVPDEVLAHLRNPRADPAIAPFVWSHDVMAGFTKCVGEVETGNGLTGIAEAPGPASACLIDSVSPVLVGAPLGITGLGRRVMPSMPAAHSVTG